ncbi:HIPL1 protein isoform X2 [Brachypodium distachyon]|uniref:HIPL1 protein isoform X2 n=1 Tax=Brachypodium distachyon TaxID=15368 RepID=UPI00071C6875|nr:HIPL1 protein isoform X2 [Brachypodium distachyon]|eukprot:XP_014758483.1 HIPL1 protein isoform X2 [Brachypodium distachyon]
MAWSRETINKRSRKSLSTPNRWRRRRDAQTTEKCNLFSAALFDTGSITRTVPLLCSSFSARGSSQPEHPTHNNGDYCGQVWKHCKSTAMLNSPFQSFAPRKVELTGSSSMLTDFWQSEKDFCVSLSSTPNNSLVCFNGHGVSFNQMRNSSPSPNGMCLEKIGNGSYLNMVGHPDGSSKAFFSREDGKIWLTTVPQQGTRDSLQLDETIPFLDLATEGHLSSDLGFVGLAFHLDFVNNGRFFVSYICDGTLSSNCAGRCSCDRDVGCDPSKIGSDNGVDPCRYQLVVSEYSAAKGSSSSFSEATYADPSEARRIFSMGLPYVSNHAGQLLFGPTDGYLYFFTGNGGIRGDPFNFSQNGKSLLGKVLRLDIDELPEMNGVSNQSLWGNYTIPKDNPHTGDSNLQPEIWAWGLENPWRCSFDSVRPFHLYCADDGQEQYKVVDLISKGGNYGWSAAHEDQDIHYPPWASQGTKPTNGIFFPIMGYTVPSTTKYAAIVGGYVYRGSADSCLYGRYLFADMYSSAMWTGTINIDGSGKYTSASIPLSCSKTPLPCDDSTDSPLGPIFSFGEDNKQDVFILANQGVYRIVQPSLCDYVCVSDATTEQATASVSGGSQGMATILKVLIGVASVLGTAGAIYLVRTCFCNNSVILGNRIGTMQVINNTTTRGDNSSLATTTKAGDIELAVTKPAEYHAR